MKHIGRSIRSMNKNEFVNKIREIEMPKDMQRRIIENCYMETEKKRMNKMFKRPMVAAASFALCVCLTGVTALAATGKLEGFFKDVKRWDGAVVGTSYEQATDEIDMKVANITDELIVEFTMLEPDTAPYSFLEMFGINEYKIVDEDGNTVIENESIEMSVLENNNVTVKIPLNTISEGKYTLVVSKLIGSAKAEQPLVISGTWECEFTF